MAGEWKKRGRRVLVWTLRILAGIVALPLLYFVTALFLGLEHGTAASSGMSMAIRSSFVALGVMTLATTLLFRRLHPNDGDNVSRHKEEEPSPPEVARA